MTKFSDERCAAILKSISNRVPYKLAAQANGICEDTLYDWLKRGLNDSEAGKDTKHARFSESLKKIEEQTLIGHLDKINNAVDRWQAHAWILERRWWWMFSANAALVEMDKRIERLNKKQHLGVDDGNSNTESTEEDTN